MLPRLHERFRTFMRRVRGNINSVRINMRRVRGDINNVRIYVRCFREEMRRVRGEMRGLRGGMRGFRGSRGGLWGFRGWCQGAHSYGIRLREKHLASNAGESSAGPYSFMKRALPAGAPVAVLESCTKYKPAARPSTGMDADGP